MFLRICTQLTPIFLKCTVWPSLPVKYSEQAESALKQTSIYIYIDRNELSFWERTKCFVNDGVFLKKECYTNDLDHSEKCKTEFFLFKRKKKNIKEWFTHNSPFKITSIYGKVRKLVQQNLFREFQVKETVNGVSSFYLKRHMFKSHFSIKWYFWTRFVPTQRSRQNPCFSI